jgi:hypothetical protein
MHSMLSAGNGNKILLIKFFTWGGVNRDWSLLGSWMQV